jgi:hypothetical protein
VNAVLDRVVELAGHSDSDFDRAVDHLIADASPVVLHDAMQRLLERVNNGKIDHITMRALILLREAIDAAEGRPEP